MNHFDRFDSEGKASSMDSVGSGIMASSRNGSRSMYSDRVFLSHFTSNPSLGEDKVNMYLADSKLTHPFVVWACLSGFNLMDLFHTACIFQR